VANDVRSHVRVTDADQLELHDLLSRVLDKGVVIYGEVTIAVADVDLVRLKLNILLGAVESEVARARRGSHPSDADLPLLHPAAPK
jgi:hypothetical protein